jgi:sialidase-1
MLAFSNPASRTYRDSLTLRISKDEGKTWSTWLLIDHQPDLRAGDTRKDYTAYSDLVLVNKKRIGVLYERNNYREIVFKTTPMRRGFTPRLP